MRSCQFAEPLLESFRYFAERARATPNNEKAPFSLGAQTLSSLLIHARANPMRFISVLSVLALASTAHSQIERDLRPGIGFHQPADSESFLEVTRTTDGYRVRTFVHELSSRVVEIEERIGEPSSFFHGWNSGDDWLLFRADESRHSDPNHPMSLLLAFAGWDTIPEGFEFVLEPHERARLFFAANADWSPPNSLYTLEYSLIPIPAPLPGDFNFSGTADVEDFLVLQENFGNSVNSITHEPLRWIDGDADFDDRVTVRDFLILSKNFGATNLATVPEPASMLLLLTSVGLLLHRCRC